MLVSAHSYVDSRPVNHDLADALAYVDQFQDDDSADSLPANIIRALRYW